MALRHEDHRRSTLGDAYWSGYSLAMVAPADTPAILTALAAAEYAPEDVSLLSGPDVLAALAAGGGVLADPTVDRAALAGAAWRGELMVVVYTPDPAEQFGLEQAIAAAGGHLVRTGTGPRPTV